MKKIKIWLGNFGESITGSIAFYPALIAIIFVGISFGAVALDFSTEGKIIKANLSWLSLQDAETARSIISSIVSGVMSLTVFSFSLVMIILNQTASQMSNRILKQLIGNRFQQVILGIYIGTIVFALYLLSTIRDMDTGISIPALSTYLLIFITIIDIFLFIYFLHYITQSVKYEVIIHRITNETLEVLKDCSTGKSKYEDKELPNSLYVVPCPKTGIYEGYNKRVLLSICEEHHCICYEINYRGTYLFKGMPLVRINKELNAHILEEIADSFYIHFDESIQNNFFYGFRQLTQVAMKALSPAVNDPATAVQALQSRVRLLIFRLHNQPQNAITDRYGQSRIYTCEKHFAEMFAESLYPVWDYGKNDRLIQDEMFRLLTYLQKESEEKVVHELLDIVAKARDTKRL